ncbi:MAG: tetratricopeptide repeat protein [Lutibacter sp.]|nr:tetratricopeptide repeat protein [Lutibacter sp.]
MKNSFKIIAGFLIALFVVNCSTKKDAFLNRSYHSVTTKYNVLYNGYEALRIGLEQLNANYEDNYWERLPIEPLKVDELAMPGMQADSDSSPQEFEKAEEKAVKAVQKHSMLIAREERNKQIDDAYLLLGKSRYYSKRFVPALEAFNYVIQNYPKANLINETIIWQAKTQVRLQNEEQAIKSLRNLLKDKSLKSDIKEHAHTVIAMAYLNLDSLQLVINHLNRAVVSENNKEQTARNLFILGQLYSEKGLKDSSNIAFQKVIDFKKAPYKYKIHAQLEKAKNSKNKLDAQETLAILKKLTKDRDNRPFLDELYYRIGIIEQESNTESAIDYFKKSLQSSSKNNLQKELSYEALGNLYFDKAQFMVAGAYYDSILNITNSENTKRVRRLVRNRNNLNEVILCENISKTNDSILTIVAMGEEEKIAFFNTHIEKLKANEAKKENKTNVTSGLFDSNLGKSDVGENSGKWYFYNIQAVGFGEIEFRKIWGNRPLSDNWRLGDKSQLNMANVQDPEQNMAQTSLEEKLELSYYLDKIPSEKAKIDSISNERNTAYFKLGIIYKEQFKELDLAKYKFKKLLTFNPDLALLVPAKYHLYKIYESQGDEKAISLKNDIVTNYATSKYAKIILNPNQALEEEEKNAAETEYAEIYYDYEAEKFETVIEKTTLAIGKYMGEPIVAKLELLRAYAIGKSQGLAAFKEALESVALNYPNTEDAKKALEVIEIIKQKL